MTHTHMFLDKHMTLVPCTVLKENAYRRTIQVNGGAQAGKTLDVHPEGVAHGRIFPRIFKVDKPEQAKVATILGRSLLCYQPNPDERAAVPHVKADYRFQPFIMDVIDSIHQAQSVILTGGTGVGKTTHIVQLAARIHQPLLRINFNGETRMSDLIGKVHVVNGETRWIDGVLPMAMRKGWWLLLDELDFAEPAVLSLLHPVLEDESMLVLKENNGEIIRPHPNFRLFATANSIGAMGDRAGAYSGTNTMNEAFLDRWQVLMVDNLPLKDEIKVLRQEAPGLKPAWAKRIAQFAQQVRAGEIQEYTGDNFSTRKTIAWAKKAALHRSTLKGAKLSWLDKMAKSEQEPMEQALKAFFGTGKRSSVRPGARKKASAAPASTGLVKRRGRPPKSATV